MTQLQTYAAPLGRVLLALMFIMSGLMKLGDISGTAGYIQSGGLPGFLVYPTIALEVVGGLFIAVGYQTRATAFLLASFSFLSGVLFHLIPSFAAEGMAAQTQFTMFLKNLSLTGAFLFLVSVGSGPIALDGRSKADT